MSEAAVGDPCEVIIGEFVFGPIRCMDVSVATVVDRTSGTTHVVCERHMPAPRPTQQTSERRGEGA